MITWVQWASLPSEDAHTLAGKVLSGHMDGGLADSVAVAGEAAALPFYSDIRLVRLKFVAKDKKEFEVFFLEGTEAFYVLNGSSGPIHAANEDAKLTITEQTAPDYLRFFCFAVRGDEGAFLLYEMPAMTPKADDEPASAAAAFARPIEGQGQDDQGRFIFDSTVHYNGHLFQSTFAVAKDGTVEMLDDDVLLDDVPPRVIPSLPELKTPNLVAPLLTASSHRTPSGIGVLPLMVELLLEVALKKQAGTRLISHFNESLEKGSPIGHFSRLVTTATPVIAIESALPFVEETVSQIVQYHADTQRSISLIRGTVDSGDDTRLHFRVPLAKSKDRGSIVLIPFHSYRNVVDSERVAHEIAALDISCLIGCERVSDLPHSLRQVIDLTLHLPRLDPDLFSDLFERVMGSPPPPGWVANDSNWIPQVHHSDFQHPLLLELSANQALDYIRERAEQRLREVEPVSGLGLADLHGLGEARRFAEDLITDIHEAIAGRLSWQYVDRGMLLVGRPGTGKTTLARAISHDCGVRFINASAAGWQAAGHLGDHIRAMRADFSRARRYAPSILFIDEIDSVGNRETFSGRNAQYSIQVVNALLEQIQGMDETAPVVIIAATNHVNNVDPALKRAGRLDRIIQIPSPNSESLAQIFRHYLERYVGEQKQSDIDLKVLGGMAFGLTGADVEFFVRGAARRARKEGRKVSQTDLIDEITRKPRDPESSPRLTPDEIRRVAVHEAGHALASFLSGTSGEDLAFISITPRSDGTLGFVARTPSERILWTRREYQETLEVFLAGRAAEEIVFGKDGVTGGARDDLKVATRSALLMTTQYALGPERKLFYSEVPTPAQAAGAEKVLSEAYTAVQGKLEENVEKLKALASALEERQEITGDEARALLSG